MITTLGGYHMCSISGIEIDGNIYPLRSDKGSIRGVDIAFLTEASRRCDISTDRGILTTVNNEINASKLIKCDVSRKTFDITVSRIFPLGEIDTDTVYSSSSESGLPTLIDMLGDSVGTLESPILPQTGSSLTEDVIEALFDNQRRTSKLICGTVFQDNPLSDDKGTYSTNKVIACSSGGSAYIGQSMWWIDSGAELLHYSENTSGYGAFVYGNSHARYISTGARTGKLKLKTNSRAVAYGAYIAYSGNNYVKKIVRIGEMTPVNTTADWDATGSSQYGFEYNMTEQRMVDIVHEMVDAYATKFQFAGWLVPSNGQTYTHVHLTDYFVIFEQNDDMKWWT